METLKKNKNITWKFNDNQKLVHTPAEISKLKCECLFCHNILTYGRMLGHLYGCKMNPSTIRFNPDKNIQCVCGSVLRMSLLKNEKQRTTHEKTIRHTTYLKSCIPIQTL